MTSLVVCGAINWDITCFVERLPLSGEEVQVERLERVPGGTGANVAVAAARILGPGAVTLVGALGHDDIARQQVATLAAEGIASDAIKTVPGEESGQAYIFVDGRGQNVIATSLGANAALSPEDLRGPAFERALQQCRGLAITDPPLEVVQALVALAEQRNLPVFWDPGVLLAHGQDALRQMDGRVDTLFCNEVEAATLFGTSESDACLERLWRLGFRNRVVLKLGDRGAALLDPAARTIVETPVLPLDSLDLQVVDTVGCGDAFLGVFAAYRILGADPPKALVMAGVAAGLNATRRETRGSPDRPTLEATEQRARNMGYVPARRRLTGEM